VGAPPARPAKRQRWWQQQAAEVLRERGPALGREPVERDLQDLGRHPPERVQRLVDVLAPVEVDLGDDVHAGAGGDVHQHPEFHPVALHERQRLQQRPPARVLAAERLREPRQFRPQRRQQRPGQQFGDATAAVGADLATERQRPVVAGLGERDRRVGQQRAEQAHHEALVHVDDVGVDEHDEVAGGRGQALPQRLALAAGGAGVGQDVGLADHLGAGGARLGGGAVGRVAVHDQYLVDQPGLDAQSLVDEPGDGADGGLLVAGGDHDAHGGPGRPPARHQVGDVEVGVVERPAGVAGQRVLGHRVACARVGGGPQGCPTRAVGPQPRAACDLRTPGTGGTVLALVLIQRGRGLGPVDASATPAGPSTRTSQRKVPNPDRRAARADRGR
jgi:hypothetical protein